MADRRLVRGRFGGRSILADPRNSKTKEILNRRIKLREPFRPLAPIFLGEHFDSYFTDDRQYDRYMLKVAKANTKCICIAPAVVHVDGTADCSASTLGRIHF